MGILNKGYPFFIPHPTNDHSPHPCTPVEPYRHWETCRVFSKTCNSETCRGASRSKRLKNPKTKGVKIGKHIVMNPNNCWTQKQPVYGQCSDIGKGLIDRRPPINGTPGAGPVRVCNQERPHRPADLRGAHFRSQTECRPTGPHRMPRLLSRQRHGHTVGVRVIQIGT